MLNAGDVYEMTGLQGYRLVNHEIRKRMLLELARRHLPAGGVLADIGCAAGDLTLELCLNGFDVIGVDFEPQRIQRARDAAKKKGLTVRFVNKDLRGLALHEPLDGLIMGEILEHFQEPRRILQDYLPFLRSRGKVLITVPNMASVRARLKLLFFGQFADHNPEHHYYFTRRRFEEHFRSLPIVILEMKTSLVELTHIDLVRWARWERTVLSALLKIAPDCGSHLVVVAQKE